ncbi:MAG: methyl-accepting chemotaxis protein, partial [Actinomycetota bacterium]|nr:methyl-accepting chemotaxis protein [Actinomycetota bacterium]
EAIAEISAIIGRINDFQLTIASAVEEQSATTNEMNRNVAEAATGAGEIAQNITGVATAAEVTTEGVAQSQQAVAELARMSADLQTAVSRFRY